MWIVIIGPPGWQRMGDGGFASPLYSVRIKRCVWITLARALVTMALRLAHRVVPCFTLDPLGWLGLGHYGVHSTPSSRDVVVSHYGQ